MRHLVRESQKNKAPKVFLVLDDLKVHHAKAVQAWLQDNKEHIEVFYLLSYSPELNPNELLNANLKAAITTKAPAQRKGHLKEAAIGHCRKKAQGVFGKDSVKYAA